MTPEEWKQRYRAEPDQRVRNFMVRHNGPPREESNENLLTTGDRKGQPLSRKELLALAEDFARSGLTKSKYLAQHQIPEWRLRRVIEGYIGLIKKIRKRKFKGKPMPIT